jgi:hypothetical protein
MENRETKTIETKGGHKVEIYSYANGREFNKIIHVQFKGATFKLSEDKESVMIENYEPGWNEAQEEEMVRLLVVSVDGNKEDVLESVCQLPWPEYGEVIAALEELLGKKKGAETKPQ